MGGFGLKLPAPEMMAGWGLALLLVSWLLTLLQFLPAVGYLSFWAQVVGIALLAAGLITSLMRGRGAGAASSSSSGAAAGSDKMWRGEKVSYGNPYGDGFMDRIRRILRGGR
jgi:hypothetical protein